jgi:uncharacterized membrane protein (DUF441 family)
MCHAVHKETKMLVNFGALCFGLVVGWVTYRTMKRMKEQAAISHIAAVIGAVGSGTVVQLFKSEEMFAAYAIGLAIGFFAYAGAAILRKEPNVLGGNSGQYD